MGYQESLVYPIDKDIQHLISTIKALGKPFFEEKGITPVTIVTLKKKLKINLGYMCDPSTNIQFKAGDKFICFVGERSGQRGQHCMFEDKLDREVNILFTGCFPDSLMFKPNNSIAEETDFTWDKNAAEIALAKMFNITAIPKNPEQKLTYTKEQIEEASGMEKIFLTLAQIEAEDNAVSNIFDTLDKTTVDDRAPKLYLYKYDGGEVFGVLEPMDYYKQTSIHDLLEDIQRQNTELEKGTHADGYLIAWGSNNETLVLKEGTFCWSTKGFYYEILQPK